MFFGDWHLGAEGTHYEQFEHDLEALEAARAKFGDQLQMVGMGDHIDGYLPSGIPRSPTQLLSPP